MFLNELYFISMSGLPGQNDGIFALTTADDTTDSANSSENSGRTKAQLVLLAGPRPAPRARYRFFIGFCLFLMHSRSENAISAGFKSACGLLAPTRF
jgi:hypothetical protein